MSGGDRTEAPPTGRPGRIILDREAAGAALAEARTIAVLGAHHEAWRPAFYVPEYLASQGYAIVPVNPRLAGQRLWGEVVRAHLGDVDRAVDMVDVFRPAEALPGHVDELLAMAAAMGPTLRTVWFQLGIRHDEVAARLAAAGLDVVQDRCTLADHRALGLGPVAPVEPAGA